ncbi:MAG: hypothetical protein AAGI09_11965 [Pseudomonadota bacterium]
MTYGLAVNPTNYRLREPTEVPTNPQCKMALRRVCGVCQHFTSSEEGIVVPGACEKFRREVHGRWSAADCEGWGRRWAHDGPS